MVRAFGSPNYCNYTELCGWGRYLAPLFTFGASVPGVYLPDLEEAGCILFWGYNPSVARLAHATSTVAAVARGAKLVVVDPRKAGLAARADHWLRVRPGTDAALALSMTHVMIEHDWYDADFVRDWTNADDEVDGVRVWDLLVARCAQYAPEVTAAITGVPAADIVATARTMWESRPVAFYTWSGLEQHSGATQTVRAIDVLYALTGSLDVPGGNVLFEAVPSNPVDGMDLLQPDRPPAVGHDRHPLGPPRFELVTGEDLYSAALDGRVTTLVGFGGNLVMAHGDSLRGREALRSLDFFAQTELFHTPTTQLADVVLPVTTPFEAEALKIGFQYSQEAQSLVQLRRPLVAPRGEARSDLRVVFDLATPSGKVELYSTTLAAHGYPPLPVFEEPLTSPRSRPDLADRYPLVLSCAKSLFFCETQHRQVAALRKSAPDPQVELYPSTAATRGIVAGDWVSVDTPHGSVRARARLSATLDPGVVVASTAGGKPARSWACPATRLTGRTARTSTWCCGRALVTRSAAVRPFGHPSARSPPSRPLRRWATPRGDRRRLL